MGFWMMYKKKWDLYNWSIVSKAIGSTIPNDFPAFWIAGIPIINFHMAGFDDFSLTSDILLFKYAPL